MFLTNRNATTNDHSVIQLFGYSVIGKSRQGFTILELLVASLLLSMLVTMLTMIFNQSSVAWSSGVASMKMLGGERAGLGAWHDIQDDILPGVTDKNATTGQSDNRRLWYRTVSLFDGLSSDSLRSSFSQNRIRTDGQCVTRAFDQIAWGSVNTRIPDRVTDDVRRGVLMTSSDASSANQGQNVAAGGGGSGGGVIVGVWSAGPNGKWGDEDDINTFPDEVN